MTHDRVVITGAGIVSAIGMDTAQVLQALRSGASGIAAPQHLWTSHTEFPVGEVKASNQEMVQQLGVTMPTINRTSLMGIMAAREAVAMAGLTEDTVAEAAFVSGTTVGGMDQSERFYINFLTDDTRNEFIPQHDCGACTETIADHVGRFAYVSSLSTACSSAANAILLGAELIVSGQADVVLAGGSECLTRFHLNGFNSLMILDHEPCKPFDVNRAGLNLGEGAAYVVLERQSEAEERGARPMAELSGWGNACDAFHQTATSPEGEGAFRAMSQALQCAGLTPQDIDYINAHGTGTPNNDVTESAAMRRVFGDAVPPVSSTKGATGHTTSASGAIESVICLLAMQDGIMPASVGVVNPDPECVEVLRQPVANAELRHVMCNSFGFGGNDSSLIFSALC